MTPGRQGVDIGTQYRSVIFHHTFRQKAAAESFRKRMDKSGRFRRPNVTEIGPARIFRHAEEYPQRYHEKQGGSGCGI
jgi:peptide-methionine (S)-S-oxide reductase